MKTVLVIEDNPHNMRLIRVVLEKHGYSSIGVPSGEAGVEVAGTDNKVDLVIMDIELPGMDGIETARQLRTLEAMSAVPIIAITSHAMKGDRERIVAAGCNGYFEKPIDPVTIVQEIEKLVWHENPDR